MRCLPGGRVELSRRLAVLEKKLLRGQSHSISGPAAATEQDGSSSLDSQLSSQVQGAPGTLISPSSVSICTAFNFRAFRLEMPMSSKIWLAEVIENRGLYTPGAPKVHAFQQT